MQVIMYYLNHLLKIYDFQKRLHYFFKLVTNSTEILENYILSILKNKILIYPKPVMDLLRSLLMYSRGLNTVLVLKKYMPSDEV